MNIEEVKKQIALPLMSPAFRKPPYRFIDRQYFIIYIRTNIELLKKLVPAPLVPESDIAMIEWIKMPNSPGFGGYTEHGLVIPCIFTHPDGTVEHVNYTAIMILDDESPILGGYLIWGFPKIFGVPSLDIPEGSSLLQSKCHIDGVPVSSATMKYGEVDLVPNADEKAKFVQGLKKTSVNVKLVPDVDGEPLITQLVAYNLEDIELQFAYSGLTRLELHQNAAAPLQDLPILEIVKGVHFKANLTLPKGRVLFDYNKAA